MEMDVPAQTMDLLFCRRGVLDVSLDEHEDVNEDIQAETKVEVNKVEVIEVVDIVETTVTETLPKVSESKEDLVKEVPQKIECNIQDVQTETKVEVNKAEVIKVVDVVETTVTETLPKVSESNDEIVKEELVKEVPQEIESDVDDIQTETKVEVKEAEVIEVVDVVETTVTETLSEASESNDEIVKEELVKEVPQEIECDIEDIQPDEDEEKQCETIEESHLVVSEDVKEGEIMNDSVWPQTADKRLLQVLKKQVQGSLELLSESSEEGLVKLMGVLDMGVSEEVEEAIMAALTDFQNIDRVSQRMTNVQTCLDDWSSHVGDAGQAALWEEEVAKRYVMEEERMVLKGEL